MNFTHVKEGNRDWGGWRARLESNQRPLASEANTLSTELRAQSIGFIYSYLTCFNLRIIHGFMAHVHVQLKGISTSASAQDACLL